MRKLIIFLYLAMNTLLGTSQTLGGYAIADYLKSAIHPDGCSSDYVTGPPDDSTWVNFNNGDVMTGLFRGSWRDTIGNELLLETSYHPDNYNIRLLLNTGLFSTSHVVQQADWLQITDTLWASLFTDCTVGMYNSGRYILPLDFNMHFGLNSLDVVVGIEINFLSTSGAPDLAGVYIISGQPSCYVNLGNDIALCQGETLVLDATTLNATYLWQDNSTNPTFNVSQQGTYWVIIKVNNCSITDTLMVEPKECEIILRMPNVFTPNNDGLNNNFIPIEFTGIKKGTLKIFSRWGLELFETNNILTGWDGKYYGQDCAEGTYFWVIHYTTITNESKNLTGFITLIK